ncbi:MAG: hypothetical protein H7343_16335 [Undibacterium sp.]|nr:hypothetical protein [Opitutaceae bacterium]
MAELMGRLRAGRRRAAAVLLAYLDFVHARYGVKGSPTARRFHAGAAARAVQLGYKLERFLVGAGDLTMERLRGILKTRGIRGEPMAPTTHPRGELDLDWERLAAVACGRSLTAPALHRVCNHQAHTMRLVPDALTARGYRRCGIYLTDEICARVDQTWPATYLHHRHTLHGEAQPLPMLIRPEWSRAEFTAWVREPRPDAVVTIHPRCWRGCGPCARCARREQPSPSSTGRRTWGMWPGSIRARRRWARPPWNWSPRN